MNKENLEIIPSKVPTGQKFVQNILSLNITTTNTIIRAAIPTADRVSADPKSEYGSIYLIASELPPMNIPHTIAAIKYFNGNFPKRF